MIFHPQNFVAKPGRFVCSDTVYALAHSCLNKPIFQEFWHHFTFGSSELCFSEWEECIFLVGNAPKLPLQNEDYSINITPEGICIAAKNAHSLRLGWLTLIDCIEAEDAEGEEQAVVASIPCGEIREHACVTNRGVHFCIFPETELWELQRFVRLCGALKYTHIVLEFWGMLQYDCLKELSWRHGYTKDQIRPIVREARDLGLEIIPMFNHWGHASASRVMHGKHVVLDQNPALQTYFTEDGWCWDIGKPKVRTLLRQIRSELTELCGEGEYFHLGCDEAYTFTHTTENMDMICGFINEVGEELRQQGRRPIIWGDMFLYRHPTYDPQNTYTCLAPTPEAEAYMLSHLKRYTIVADWQYDAQHAPFETAAAIRKYGLDCWLCPSDQTRTNVEAALETVRYLGLNGYLYTTWHTLTKGMPFVLLAAQEGWETSGAAENSPTDANRKVAAEHVKSPAPLTRTYCAALLRKVMPACGNYERAGWSKEQVGFRW